MSDEIKQNPEGKSHKELRKEYTFNKLKGIMFPKVGESVLKHNRNQTLLEKI